MKNFTKLLMAVVLLASYSCVQDTTEDLAPVISGSGSGSGEAKTLQVSLPISARTELGEKNADGKYPVYWSEGDKLAVNGAQTTGITIDADNKAVAVFEMPLSVSIPYNIVYPYPGDEVTVKAETGRYPVKFMTNQNHVEEKETFAPGSAPMYAWSNGFTDVSMHHLSTVLRFSIKAKAGEDVKLRYVSVSTLDSEPIAGIFDVYCGGDDEKNDANVGSLEAREGAGSTIFYNFKGDEFQLSETESVFYIAVPHGAYSGFEVDFVDVNGGVCVRTFDADGEFELKAGKVRSFPTIDFEVNSKMLLISSEDDMLTFAKLVGEHRFDDGAEDKLDGALLVNNIKMTKAWTSVENFHSLFEGRDYTIEGLTTPLFGSDVDAEISNVNVVADIEETANGKVGAIARSLAVGGKILNCSANGSIKYDYTDITVNDTPDLINIGGVVGSVCGGSVIGSNSYVDIVVANSAKAGETGAYKPCVGGIVGYVKASDDNEPVVVENNSHGSIAWQDQSEADNVVPFIGGVAGYVTAGSFTDNINHGELSIYTNMDDLDWGGVAGVSSVSVERCENKGELTVDKQINTANIGGVLGKLETGSIKDCKNSGRLNFKDHFKIMKSCNIGGVVANTALGTETISGCENLGAITYLGKCSYGSPNEVSNNALVRIGGVVGLAYSKSIINCTNKLGSDISVKGEVSSVDYDNENGRDVMSSISGVVAAHYNSDGDALISNCSNAGKLLLNFSLCGKAPLAMSACVGLLASSNVENCDNLESGEIEVSVSTYMTNGADSGNFTTTLTELNIAGLIGHITIPTVLISDCSNDGSLIYNEAQAEKLRMGGVLCQSQHKVPTITMTRCGNNGSMSVGRNTEIVNLFMGGIVPDAYAFRSIVMNECSNQNKVEFYGTVGNAYIGGIYGQSLRANQSKKYNVGIKNTGRVIFGETAVAETLYLGGYSGQYIEGTHYVKFQNGNNGSTAKSDANKAAIEVAGTITGTAYIGGFSGKAQFADAGVIFAENNFSSTHTEIANYGHILVSEATRANKLYVSGCCGYADTKYNASQFTGGVMYLKNYGTVEVAYPNTKNTAEYPEFVYMGGVVGYVELNSSKSTSEGTVADTSKLLLECDNDGSIIYNGIARDGAYIGGVAGKAYNAVAENCHNTGKILSTGNAGSLSAQADEAGENAAARRSPQLHYRDLAIGGVVGETNRDINNCTNGGKVYHEATINPLKLDVWGEGVSSRFDIGGVVGRIYTYTESTKNSKNDPIYATPHVVNLLSLINSGVVELDGDYPFCTRNTTSYDMVDNRPQSNDIDDETRINTRPFYRTNMAGIVGRLHDHDIVNNRYYVKDCSNSGKVRTAERAQALKSLNIAGVAADILVSHATFNNASNSGEITVSSVGVGTNVATTTRHGAYFVNMGGVAAQIFDCRYYDSQLSADQKVYHKTLTFNNCANSGPIFYNETAASMYQTAGGILAQALHMSRASNSALTDPLGRVIARVPSDLILTFNGCSNSGEIKYRASALALKISDNNESFSYGGGIVGNVSCSSRDYRQQRFAAVDLIVDNCTNTAPIQFERNSGNYSPNISYYTSMVGGIVGNYVGGVGCAVPSYLTDDIFGSTRHYYSAKITNCTNMGRVHGFSGIMGGIIGIGQWFVDIENCTNSAPVVMAEGDNPAYRNIYGDKKVMDAGGIAGILTEYYSDNRYMKDRSSEGNEGWWPYPLGTQYTRVVNCTNSGNVGGTDFVGGIVGQYRSLRMAADEIAPGSNHRGGIENCINTGKIYALDGLTIKVGAIVGSSRMFALTDYTSLDSNAESDAVSAKSWQVGVRNCKVGGMVLRGANNKTEASAATNKSHGFAHLIYGETWADDNVSIFEDKPYDGCEFYATSTGGNTDSEEGEGAETTVRR